MAARRPGVDRILLALAGNLPNYEEASRALWAGDLETFATLAKAWPPDLAGWATGLLCGELGP